MYIKLVRFTFFVAVNIQPNSNFKVYPAIKYVPSFLYVILSHEKEFHSAKKIQVD